MLTVMTSAVLALTATPALAAGLPYGDTDPEHYSAVDQVNDNAPCTVVGCEFSATATDFTDTLDTSSGQIVYSCEEAEIEYSIDSPGGFIDDFDIVDAQWDSGDCFFWPREQAVCAYSPSGNFVEDTEYWLRDDWGSGNGNPAFEPAFGRIAGDQNDSMGTIVAEAISFNGQEVGAGLAPGYIHSWTVDGEITIDDVGVTFQLSNGRGGSCGSVFPELTS